MQLDMTARSLYAMSYDPTGLFTNERLKTCEDKHRSSSLENLAVKYQDIATEGKGGDAARQRQELLWKIFDDYYERLPEKPKETEADKIWRLCLARMDRRKMKITTEKKDDKTLISFNPEIDPELKKYSEDSLASISEAWKYMPLMLWARNRFERNEAYKQYPQYEDDYKLAISETKKIVEGLEDDKSEDQSFTLFYRSVPSYVCTVLIQDFLDKLDAEERKFCKDVIIKQAAAPLGDSYGYQIGDGIDAAISALPLLLNLFPDDAAGIKRILLFTLFDSNTIGAGQQFSDYTIGAIFNVLWKESYADANSIFIGFMRLKPLYDKLLESCRQEYFRQEKHDLPKSKALEAFYDKYHEAIDRIINNEIDYSEIDVNQIDLDTLVTAFRLLPIEISDEVHKTFMRQVFPIFSKEVFKDRHKRDKEHQFDYMARQTFLEKLAYIILSAKAEEIESYLKPFLDDFEGSDGAKDFFREFVSVEDRVAQYEQFWIVWKLFYPKLVALAQGNSPGFYSKEVIYNYLLAGGYWREDAREWHTLKDREKSFFKKVSEDMGSSPSVLYSLAKLLTDIGSGFKDDGIFWISEMLKNNPGLSSKELEVNTVYYLENLVRSYIFKNHHKVRTTLRLKNQIMIILDFLLEKGSVTAHLLREDIL
jgi:hypothetical protein